MPRVAGVKFCNSCGFRFATATSAAASSVISQPPISATQVQLTVGGKLNGKYTIVKEIGAGGMGAVYLAEDQILKRRVVIKALLTDDDPDLVAQSVKEREFLAAIKHANIVSIYDFITVGTRGYIVMEYVQGKTLDQIMEEQGRPFDVASAITYILGILPAFSYLAKLGLVYCDFKPQNVMLEILKDGSQIVKLIDLGTVIKYVPKPGDVYGTHGFYAPEAVKTPSPETDLYSICRTLAYMVTMMDLANPIFGMPTQEQYQVFRDHPELYRLLFKGTHPKVAQRFHTVQDLADQLVGVQRLIVGGKPGVSVGSRLFVASATTTSGKLGARGEVALDEDDKVIDLLRVGDQALRNGNYTSALTTFKQAVSSNIRSLDAHLRLAEVLIDMGEFSQVEAELAWAQRLAPKSWKVTWYTGRFLEAQGQFTSAADKYRELLDELPGELPPLQALARVSASQGDDSNAIHLYTSVLKADPSNTDAILGVTNSLLNLQQWDEVTRVLSGVSESVAKYVDAQLLLADLYLNRIAPLTGQNIEHASHAVQALAGRTEDARYYLARADVYRAAWQLARANQLPSNVTIAGVPNTETSTLGAAAETSYKEYLRREQYPANRETIVRHQLEVAPWRLW
jgi:serine/threonine-protein kinase PknG